VWYSNETGREEIKDYRGLSRTNPLMALAIMVSLFSLAGIPPLSGFVGKFFLFKIASGAGFHWLVAVAAVNSTISLYYYLRVVRQMYIEAPFGASPAGALAEAGPIRLRQGFGGHIRLREGFGGHIRVTPALAVTSAVLAVAVVLLGIVPFFYNLVSADTLGWLATIVP
jgi:NADH:ubiquinone oxidoreductase subunit 2 (subunit N)